MLTPESVTHTIRVRATARDFLRLARMAQDALQIHDHGAFATIDVANDIKILFALDYDRALTERAEP